MRRAKGDGLPRQCLDAITTWLAVVDVQALSQSLPPRTYLKLLHAAVSPTVVLRLLRSATPKPGSLKPASLLADPTLALLHHRVTAVLTFQRASAVSSTDAVKACTEAALAAAKAGRDTSPAAVIAAFQAVVQSARTGDAAPWSPAVVAVCRLLVKLAAADPTGVGRMLWRGGAGIVPAALLLAVVRGDTAVTWDALLDTARRQFGAGQSPSTALELLPQTPLDAAVLTATFDGWASAGVPGLLQTYTDPPFFRDAMQAVLSDPNMLPAGVPLFPGWHPSYGSVRWLLAAVARQRQLAAAVPLPATARLLLSVHSQRPAADVKHTRGCIPALLARLRTALMGASGPAAVGGSAAVAQAVVVLLAGQRPGVVVQSAPPSVLYDVLSALPDPPVSDNPELAAAQRAVDPSTSWLLRIASARGVAGTDQHAVLDALMNVVCGAEVCQKAVVALVVAGGLLGGRAGGGRAGGPSAAAAVALPCARLFAARSDAVGTLAVTAPPAVSTLVMSSLRACVPTAHASFAAALGAATHRRPASSAAATADGASSGPSPALTALTVLAGQQPVADAAAVGQQAAEVLRRCTDARSGNAGGRSVVDGVQWWDVVPPVAAVVEDGGQAPRAAFDVVRALASAATAADAAPALRTAVCQCIAGLYVRCPAHLAAAGRWGAFGPLWGPAPGDVLVWCTRVSGDVDAVDAAVRQFLVPTTLAQLTSCVAPRASVAAVQAATQFATQHASLTCIALPDLTVTLHRIDDGGASADHRAVAFHCAGHTAQYVALVKILHALVPALGSGALQRRGVLPVVDVVFRLLTTLASARQLEQEFGDLLRETGRWLLHATLVHGDAVRSWVSVHGSLALLKRLALIYPSVAPLQRLYRALTDGGAAEELARDWE